MVGEAARKMAMLQGEQVWEGRFLLLFSVCFLIYKYLDMESHSYFIASQLYTPGYS